MAWLCLHVAYARTSANRVRSRCRWTDERAGSRAGPDRHPGDGAASPGQFRRWTAPSLPDELRECLILRELEDMTYKEIARVIG